jgi:hypothetical protein
MNPSNQTNGLCLPSSIVYWEMFRENLGSANWLEEVVRSLSAAPTAS